MGLAGQIAPRRAARRRFGVCEMEIAMVHITQLSNLHHNAFFESTCEVVLSKVLGCQSVVSRQPADLCIDESCHPIEGPTKSSTLEVCLLLRLIVISTTSDGCSQLGVLAPCDHPGFVARSESSWRSPLGRFGDGTGSYAAEYLGGSWACGRACQHRKLPESLIPSLG